MNDAKEHIHKWGNTMTRTVGFFASIDEIEIAHYYYEYFLNYILYDTKQHLF